MRMVKYILSIVFILILKIDNAQSLKLDLKDSLAISVNEVYIDRLNQIYVFTKNTTDFIKLNENLSINQKFSSPFLSQYIFLDVKDPMKLLLYLPQFNNVNIYDESLAAISDEYFSDFNSESTICFYNSTQICYFANNKINVKNINNQNLQSGEQIFYSRKKLNQVSQIKTNGRDIYLLLPGIGLWHYNAFLNIESFIEDYEIDRIELMDDKLYYLKSGQIYLRLEKEFKDILISPSIVSIERFAMNKNYFIAADKHSVKRYIIQSITR